MKRNEAPKKQPVPFAIGGLREDLLPTTPAGDNTASYINGFPPITMVQKNAGGLPPKGQDMNQILYELSNLSRWSSSGAINSFDADFSTKIGGYPKGATLLGDDGSTIYINTIDDNASNPNSGGSGWFNQTNGYLKTLSFFSEIAAIGPSGQYPARQNLSLDRFVQDSNETRIYGPGGSAYIFASDKNWGAYDSSIPGNIALSITSGGTGGTTAPAARAGLGLKGASILDVGTTAGTVASGNDSRIVGAMQVAQNGGDIQDKATFRENLGLGSSATLPVGTSANTVAAGNDSRITGAAQKSSNLSDLSSSSDARANLGLGPAALRFVGTGTNQLPDMNAFATSLGQNGWFKLPSGVIYQWGTSSAATPSSPDVLVTFPIPFPNAVLAMGEHDRGSQTSLTLWQFTSVVSTAFYANAVASIQRGNSQVGSVPQSAACLWWALGY
ncbi:gp53-like domain-containing protein [Ewingella sp. AOP9-I1-14]